MTTVPWLAVTMEGRNSRTRRKWERMFTAKIRSREVSVDLRIVKLLPMPALLIRIVGCPRVERTEAAVLETASGEVMSQVKWWMSWPERGLEQQGIAIRSPGPTRLEGWRLHIQGSNLNAPFG